MRDNMSTIRLHFIFSLTFVNCMDPATIISSSSPLPTHQSVGTSSCTLKHAAYTIFSHDPMISCFNCRSKQPLLSSCFLRVNVMRIDVHHVQLDLLSSYCSNQRRMAFKKLALTTDQPCIIMNQHVHMVTSLASFGTHA